jgi:hypothetical protein
MKIRITESQLKDMVPLNMRRKSSRIYSWIDTLFNTEDYRNDMKRQAQDMSLEDFMLYINRYIQSLIVMTINNAKFLSAEDSIAIIIRDRVEEFWKESNNVK